MSVVRGVSALTLLVLTGCASQSWQHTSITLPDLAAKQFKIDNGYCTLVAAGAAPMPAVAAAAPQPTATYVSGQVRAYNTTTGQTTYGTYSGTANTVSSGGFGGGFSSGVASGASLGAAIAASQAQERIQKACMTNKGWVEVPAGTSIAAPSRPPTVASKKEEPSTPVGNQVYASPSEEWAADINEFMVFYPAYKQGTLHQALDQKVRSFGEAGISGPLALMMAHEALVKSGNAAPAPSGDLSQAYGFYVKGADGLTLDQSALGAMYLTGAGGLPQSLTRAAYWAQKSAQFGLPAGQVLYGYLLFRGDGIKANRVDAYRLMKQAAATDADAKSLLKEFELAMPPEELQAAR